MTTRHDLNTHHDLAHRWATGNYRVPRRTVGNMLRDGRSIYSWGPHYCIATLDPDTHLPPADDLTAEPRPVCWVNANAESWTTAKKHSGSTNTHTRIAVHAAEDAGYNIVPVLSHHVHTETYGVQNMLDFTHAYERERALVIAEHWVGKAKRARVAHSIRWHTESARRALSHYRLSCHAAGLPVDHGAIEDVEQELFLIRARGLFRDAA